MRSTGHEPLRVKTPSRNAATSRNTMLSQVVEFQQIEVVTMVRCRFVGMRCCHRVLVAGGVAGHRVHQDREPDQQQQRQRRRDLQQQPATRGGGGGEHRFFDQDEGWRIVGLQRKHVPLRGRPNGTVPPGGMRCLWRLADRSAQGPRILLAWCVVRGGGCILVVSSDPVVGLAGPNLDICRQQSLSQHGARQRARDREMTWVRQNPPARLLPVCSPGR